MSRGYRWLQFIDARLAEQETDGWRYDDMPEDGQAWRDSLRYLDEDAQAKFGVRFARVRRQTTSARSSRRCRTPARGTGTA